MIQSQILRPDEAGTDNNKSRMLDIIEHKEAFLRPPDPTPEITEWKSRHVGIWGWITSFFDPCPKVSVEKIYYRGYIYAFDTMKDQVGRWQ